MNLFVIDHFFPRVIKKYTYSIIILLEKWKTNTKTRV